MSNAYRQLQVAAVLAVLVSLASWPAAGQAPQSSQVYRYVDADGHVVYSDKPPPANAKNAQTKRLGGNMIETDDLSYASQQAQERFPVTLYTFNCGVVCDTAEGVLNKRGVPHTVVDVSSNDGADKLKRLTSSLDAPVLQVGDQFTTGFQEAKWQSMLTDAGYPKTPAPRTIPAAKSPQASDATAVATPPPASGEYPK